MRAAQRRAYAASFRVGAAPQSTVTVARALRHAEEDLGLLKNVIAPRQIERGKWGPDTAAEKIACQTAIVLWLRKSLLK